MATGRNLATYADLLALKEDLRGEILGGEIVTQPISYFEHARILRCVGKLVDPYDTSGPDGWWIVLGMEIRFTLHDVTRSDLAGWRRVRLRRPPRSGPVEVAPDWVCEVLSPTTATRDRVYKKRLYARQGIAHYWLIDPEERTLEALTLEGGRWVEVGTYDDTALARIPPFEAVELAVGRLFLPPEVNEA